MGWGRMEGKEISFKFSICKAHGNSVVRPGVQMTVVCTVIYERLTLAKRFTQLVNSVVRPGVQMAVVCTYIYERLTLAKRFTQLDIVLIKWEEMVILPGLASLGHRAVMDCITYISVRLARCYIQTYFNCFHSNMNIEHVDMIKHVYNNCLIKF